MDSNYLYYITRETHSRDLPVISKYKKDNAYAFRMLNPDEGEGPFNSLYELKKRSIIFNGIKHDKHKQRISTSKNIKEITDFILTDSGTTCDISFLDAIAHATIGKISNKQVSGVHLLNPDKVRIIEILQVDPITGVYSANIELLNENTGKWVKKRKASTLFPDDWSIPRLFHECLFAYNNKNKISEKVYISKTVSGIPVEFIINENNKILTIYPILAC